MERFDEKETIGSHLVGGYTITKPVINIVPCIQWLLKVWVSLPLHFLFILDELIRGSIWNGTDFFCLLWVAHGAFCDGNWPFMTAL
jgi:hypothetical protein